MPYNSITQAAIDVAVRGTPALPALRAAIEAKHPGAVARARERETQARFERKFKGNPPSWVKRYVAKYAKDVAQLRWHRSRVGSFHGVCQHGWHDEISVTVPADLPLEREDEARILVLHELAHTKDPWDQHGDKFYDHWCRMLKSEGLYRKAVAHYGSRRGGSLRAAARRARK